MNKTKRQNPTFTYKIIKPEDIIANQMTPLREMTSQEQELQSLDILEKVTECNLGKSISLIKVLDKIAPERINNNSFMSWKTYSDWTKTDKKGRDILFKRTYGGLYAMMEDIVMVTAFFSPELCKTMVRENDKTSYFNIELPKNFAEGDEPEVKKSKIQMREIGNKMLREVSSIIGIKDWIFKEELFDEFICVGELMNFYCDKLIEENTPEEKLLKKQWGCLILSLLDVFGDFSYELKTSFVSEFYKEVALPFDVREKVKKNRFLFTNLSPNITVMQ